MCLVCVHVDLPYQGGGRFRGGLRGGSSSSSPHTVEAEVALRLSGQRIRASVPIASVDCGGFFPFFFHDSTEDKGDRSKVCQPFAAHCSSRDVAGLVPSLMRALMGFAGTKTFDPCIDRHDQCLDNSSTFLVMGP